jgi:poly [ADP-ribose] polymerase
MYAYFIKVEPGENNNKFYEMKDNNDGTFTAYWGRVGSSPQKKVYAISQWNSVSNQKLKKGYRDITHTRAKPSSKTSEDNHHLNTTSHIIRDIFSYLLSSTKENVAKNYMVAVSGVTQAMIDEAQDILNSLVSVKDGGDWTRFNTQLVNLFRVLPRNMRNVRDYLLPLDIDDISIEAANMIQREQDTLDSLKGQVIVSDNEDEESTTVSLFDTMGIEVSDILPEDESQIKQLLEDSQHRYRSAVRVKNHRTARAYRDWVITQEDKTEKLLWHGSRNQNWISLLQQGLVRYPTNAAITGKMFGYGLYFAPRAKKSVGYTSLQGSYWAHGNDSRGYMGLFTVHTGKMKGYTNAQSHLTFDIVNKMGYNSVIGQKGYYLQNDEIIVYQECQTDIEFLVELK